MDWFENENFWRTLYPFMFSPERFASAPGEVDRILALAGRPVHKVLDLCCGPGRHSLELAARGLEVTGVDRSVFLLDHARERATAAGATVEWVLEDVRHFRRPSSFDLALSWFTSFGYFNEDSDNRLALRNVCDSLTPGGILAMDLLGKEMLARMWQDARVTDTSAGATLVQRSTVLEDWSRIRNHWVWIHDGVADTFEFEHWVYSGLELKERLIDAGFSSVRLCGDLSGAPYGLQAQRLIAMARK